MKKTVAIGYQDFETVRTENLFYIDKTDFIRQWWEAKDQVTLITRPRRFGKTLNMSMVEKFFSVDYAGRSDLFESLSIWEKEEYRNLQGTYPVLFITFADMKETDFSQFREGICRIIRRLYKQFDFLLESDLLSEGEKEEFRNVSAHMGDNEAAFSLKALSDYLSRYYGKKVILLLDEYDTPMQEAYVNGYWEEAVNFIRRLFNAAFKTNPYMERALMTGITRVSRESIFSDFNNPKVVTTTSRDYEDCFGFTEEEVFAALDEYGLSEKKQDVKTWYDGFTFGNKTDIYNPWSIIHYLREGIIGTYWANTSSNSLAGKLIREGSSDIKADFEVLLQGRPIYTELDEQVIYDQLEESEQAVWSLLLAAGYLKFAGFEKDPDMACDPKSGRIMKPVCGLMLTNLEVRAMFENMVQGWFRTKASKSNYNGFIKALLLGDVKAMNVYMNRVALKTFSYFDTGKLPSESEPERFYHGFVLGLMVELSGRYTLTSNRESGFGRYDVMLEPKNKQDDGIILEFKVRDPEDETCLEETAAAALAQIEEKKYAAALTAKGIPEEKIRSYGFAFEGKKVLILGNHTESRISG